MGASKPHSDQKYIDALLHNNKELITEIYEKFAPKIINYIKNNSGNSSVAQDIIQETLVTIYKQAQQKGLTLSCPFEAYFFLLCKRKWLNELKKTSQKKVTINEEITSITSDSEMLVNETEIFNAKQELFVAMFDRLGAACKELLRTTFSIKSMEEVAKKLGQSYAYVRKKKSLCIGQLTKLIQNDPKFNQIKNLL